MQVALAARQPLSEVLSWDDWTLATVLQELDDLAERRSRGGR